MSEHKALLHKTKNQFIANNHKIHTHRQKTFMRHSVGIFATGLTMMALAFSLASAAEVRKFVAIEPELGSRSGVAVVIDDNSTSGKKHVSFPQPATPPPPPPPTPTAKVRRFPGDPNPKLYNKSYWGAGINGNGDPSKHENPTGKSLSIRRTFYQWSHATNLSSSMYNTVANDHANNRLPFVSIKTPGWKAMADGNYDSSIDAMLNKLDSYGKPVWLTVHHEPEGGGGSGNSPDDPGGAYEWRRMQVKIRERMNAVGTKNVAFMPILMTYTWQNSSGRNPNDWWVDGVWDAYCVDHYNDSESGSILKQSWFDFVSWIEAKNMPYCVGEWGNRGTNAQAGQEMRDYWNWTFDNNKDMIGYNYFDSGLNSPSGSWELAGQQLTVFQDILKNDSKVQRINDL